MAKIVDFVQTILDDERVAEQVMRRVQSSAPESEDGGRSKFYVEMASYLNRKSDVLDRMCSSCGVNRVWEKTPSLSYSAALAFVQKYTGLYNMWRSAAIQVIDRCASALLPSAPGGGVAGQDLRMIEMAVLFSTAPDAFRKFVAPYEGHGSIFVGDNSIPASVTAAFNNALGSTPGVGSYVPVGGEFATMGGETELGLTDFNVLLGGQEMKVTVYSTDVKSTYDFVICRNDSTAFFNTIEEMQASAGMKYGLRFTAPAMAGGFILAGAPNWLEYYTGQDYMNMNSGNPGAVSSVFIRNTQTGQFTIGVALSGVNPGLQGDGIPKYLKIRLKFIPVARGPEMNLVLADGSEGPQFEGNALALVRPYLLSSPTSGVAVCIYSWLHSVIGIPSYTLPQYYATFVQAAQMPHYVAQWGALFYLLAKIRTRLTI